MAGTPVAYFILGMVFVALGVPLVQRRIPRNRWYGFRVRKTLATDAVWYAANEVAGRDMIWAGTIVAIVALASMGLAGTAEPATVAMVNLGVFAVAMVAASVHSFQAVKRL
jgi:uncharacterized membrane protein